MLRAPLSGTELGSSESSFVIAEWTCDPCPATGPEPQAPLHLHRLCDEAWYVLEGSLCVRVGEEVVTLTAGSAVLVERGTPHTFWNPTSEPTRYLLTMTSKTHRLIEAIHATSDRSFSHLKQLFEDYDAELIGD